MGIARLSDQAKADIVDIWEYIAIDSVFQADRFITKLVKQYKSLASTPGIGRLRKELRSSLRTFPVGNYLILYRLISEGIAVVRVLHGARDIPTVLDGEPGETYRFLDEEADPFGN